MFGLCGCGDLKMKVKGDFSIRFQATDFWLCAPVTRINSHLIMQVYIIFMYILEHCHYVCGSHNIFTYYNMYILVFMEKEQTHEHNALLLVMQHAI